jgi:hypothetical protein
VARAEWQEGGCETHEYGLSDLYRSKVGETIPKHASLLAASGRYSGTLINAQSKRAPPRCGAVLFISKQPIQGTAMHGKTSKFASTILSALLYTQGLLGIAGVTLVVVKDRVQVDAVLAMNVASADAQLR